MGSFKLVTYIVKIQNQNKPSALNTKPLVRIFTSQVWNPLKGHSNGLNFQTKNQTVTLTWFRFWSFNFKQFKWSHIFSNKMNQASEASYEIKWKTNQYVVINNNYNSIGGKYKKLRNQNFKIHRARSARFPRFARFDEEKVKTISINNLKINNNYNLSKNFDLTSKFIIILNYRLKVKQKSKPKDNQLMAIHPAAFLYRIIYCCKI